MLIGELMKQTGLSRDTIRFYEEIGLLKCSTVPAGSRHYKDYPPEMVARIQDIKQAQNAGFTLREIKSILEEWGGDVSQIPDEQIVCLLNAKIEQIEQRLLDLKATHNYLTQKLECLQNR